MDNDKRVIAMHQAAEIFEPQTEMVYKFLQVCKKTCIIAHVWGLSDGQCLQP